jgi:predicted porin
MVGLNTSASDQNAGVAVSHVNFAYTGIANTTLIAGKQAVPSPFAVQADSAGGEDNGTGLTGVVNAGPVTIAGTYLNQTNLQAINGQDVAGLGLMGNVGPVALDGWYLQVLESSANNDAHTAYTVGATAKIEMVKLTGRYSAIDHDNALQDTEKLWKVGASAKVGIVGFGVEYGQTNDVRTNTTGVSLENDGGADSDTTMQAWATNLEGKDDASLLKVSANVDLMSNLNLSATYADLAIDGTTANDDVNEIYGQLTYKMGKNFMTYARFGQVDDDSKTDKGTRGRLHVQYTF